MEQQAPAVSSGHWPLYRYNPELAAAEQNPFVLDSQPPKQSLESYIYREGRYRILQQSNPQAAERLLELAKKDVDDRWATIERLAGLNGSSE